MEQTKQDPLIGHTLAGTYKIIQHISEEELGQVYDAVQLPQNTPVSIKVLNPNLVEDKEAFGRFCREMLATATVQHPNTVQMLDFGEHRQIFHFIVLERLYARPLAQVMAEERFNAQRVAHVAAQVASALAAAHREKIVHRNLCPANILLLDNAEKGDFVKVRDFGLARLQDEQGNPQDGGLTEFGVRVGQLQYMAPEYIRDGVVEPRCDLYALGVLMFEMLTGRPPFAGVTATLIEQHLTKPPPAPSTLEPSVPKWMDEIVLQLLDKDPHKRPRGASEVISLLQKHTGNRLAPPKLVHPEAALSRGAAGGSHPGGARKKGAGGAVLWVALGGGLLLVGIVVVLLAVLGVFAAS